MPSKKAVPAPIEEIEAARQAGFHIALSVRPGNQAGDTAGVPCQIINSFDELLVDQETKQEPRANDARAAE